MAIRNPKAFPSGEGGSRVPRKRETDEGRSPLMFSLIRPLRRAPSPKGRQRLRIVTGGIPEKARPIPISSRKVLKISKR